MGGLSFSELVRAIVATLATAWRPCQPLLATAALIALAVAAVVGLVLPGTASEMIAQLLMFALTLLVSAGIAGFVVSGGMSFTRLGSVLREPRSFVFVMRYMLLSIGISLPMLAILPLLAVPGDGPGIGVGLIVLGVLLAILWLAARLAPFPYSVFGPQPLSLGETFARTQGQALKIIGCVVLFGGGIVVVLMLGTVLLGGVISGLGSATGLGGGAAAGLALQSLGQIAAAYAIDCVYGTITRLVTANTPAKHP